MALVFDAILNSVSASIDWPPPVTSFAGGARVDHFSVFDHAQRHARQVVLGHHRIEDRIEGLLSATARRMRHAIDVAPDAQQVAAPQLADLRLA